MGFPSDKELKSIRTKLEKTNPSRLLPKNASEAEKIKFKICEKFVIYLLENDLTQVDLARKLKINRSRVNEIVKYKIELFTIDTLLGLAERLKLAVKVDVA